MEMDAVSSIERAVLAWTLNKHNLEVSLWRAVVMTTLNTQSVTPTLDVSIPGVWW
jgi:hypothetical protein